jgi:hypothetical protein
MERAIRDKQKIEYDAKASQAFKCHYFMSDSEFEIVKEIFPLPVLHSPYLNSSHPVASTLSDYAHSKLINEIDVVEIGPNPLKSKASQWFTVITDARDEKRQNEYLITLLNRKQITNMQKEWITAYTTKTCTENICIKGITHCDPKFPKAISLHSLYDISSSELEHLFEHGIISLSAYMYLPIELIGDKSFNNYYSFWLENENAVMNVGTTKHSAFCYKHNYNNWRKYLITSKIECRNFNILFEINEWQGCQAQLTLTKTHYPGELVCVHHPDENKTLWLPDIVKYVKGEEAYVYPIPQETYREALTYALSLATPVFNQTAVLTFLRGRTSGVRLGNILRLKSWNTTPENLMNCSISIYYIAQQMRKQASENLVPMRDIAHESFHLQPHKKIAIGDKSYKVGKHLTKFLSKIGVPKADDKWLCETKRFKTLRSREAVVCTDSEKIYSLVAKPTQSVKITRTIIDRKSFFHLPILDPNKILVPTPLGQSSTSSVIQSSSIKPATVDPNLSLKIHDMDMDKYPNEPLAQNEIDLITECRDKLESLNEMGHFLVKNLEFPTITKFSKLKTILGVPGAGKSFYLKQSYSDWVIIVPTKFLQEQYVKEGFDAFTQHTGLKHVTGKNVIIDEVFQLDCGLVYSYLQLSERLVVVGDINQIGRIDFEGQEMDRYQINSNYLTVIKELNVTRRCPRDVTFFLKDYYSEISTISNVKTSIAYRTIKNFRSASGKIICFSQNTKTYLSQFFQNVNTIHEVQGQTFDHVSLIVPNEDFAILAKSRSHCIVGITRHRITLNIFTDDGNRLLNIKPEIYERLNLLEQPEIEEIREIPVVGDESLSPGGFAPSPQAIDTMLDKITVGTELELRLAPKTFEIPENTNALINDYQNNKEIQQGAHMSGKVYAHETKVIDRDMTLYTLIKRYAGSILNNTLDPHSIAEKLWLNFQKFLINSEPVEQINLENHTLDLIRTMFNRGTLEQINEDDILTKGMTEINFFLKQQSKVKTCNSEDGVVAPGQHNGKAGQGVSAWSKDFNLLFGPYVRHVQEALTQVLKPNILFCYNRREGAFDEFFSKMCAIEGDILETDITEFDSTHSKVTLIFENLLMKHFGVPQPILNFYTAVRSQWKLNSYQVGCLLGEGKQHSGQPATLFSNTLLTLVIAMTYLENLENCYVAVKGDDFICKGKFNVDKENPLFDAIHAKVKETFNKPPQFVNHFVTPQGLLPDLVRLSAKVKSYALKSHLVNERIKNVFLVNGEKSGKIDVKIDNEHPALLAEKVDYSLIYSLCSEAQTVSIPYSPKINYNKIHKLIPDAKIYVTEIRNQLATHALQVQVSVRDRISPIDNEVRKVTAISFAAEYYNLSLEEVEYAYDWLTTYITSDNPTSYYEFWDTHLIPVDLYNAIQEQADVVYMYGKDKVKIEESRSFNREEYDIRSTHKLTDSILPLLKHFKNCIDVSAAPGGWSSKLRQQGKRVRSYFYSKGLKMMDVIQNGRKKHNINRRWLTDEDILDHYPTSREYLNYILTDPNCIPKNPEPMKTYLTPICASNHWILAEYNSDMEGTYYNSIPEMCDVMEEHLNLMGFGFMLSESPFIQSDSFSCGYIVLALIFSKFNLTDAKGSSAWSYWQELSVPYNNIKEIPDLKDWTILCDASTCDEDDRNVKNDIIQTDVAKHFQRCEQIVIKCNKPSTTINVAKILSERFNTVRFLRCASTRSFSDEVFVIAQNLPINFNNNFLLKFENPRFIYRIKLNPKTNEETCQYVEDISTTHAQKHPNGTCFNDSRNHYIVSLGELVHHKSCQLPISIGNNLASLYVEESDKLPRINISKNLNVCFQQIKNFAFQAQQLRSKIGGGSKSNKQNRGYQPPIRFSKRYQFARCTTEDELPTKKNDGSWRKEKRELVDTEQYSITSQQCLGSGRSRGHTSWRQPSSRPRSNFLSRFQIHN